VTYRNIQRHKASCSLSAIAELLVTTLGEMTDADKVTNLPHLDLNLLIRKSGFECWSLLPEVRRLSGGGVNSEHIPQCSIISALVTVDDLTLAICCVLQSFITKLHIISVVTCSSHAAVIFMYEV